MSDDPRPAHLQAANWNRQRKRVLQRDSWQCTFCGKDEQAHQEQHDTGLHVHHIIPRDEMGSDGMKNLITLCAECHGTAEKISTRIFRTQRSRESSKRETFDTKQHVVIAYNNLTDAKASCDGDASELQAAQDILEGWLDV